MEAWLYIATKHAIVAINALALIVIVIGTVEAFVRGLRALLQADNEHREVWIRYGRSRAGRGADIPARRRHHRDLDHAVVGRHRPARRGGADPHVPQFRAEPGVV